MGFFRDSRGIPLVGTDFPYWGDVTGSCNGRIHDDGTIPEYGRIVGTIDDGGTVYGRYGYEMDYTYED